MKIRFDIRLYTPSTNLKSITPSLHSSSLQEPKMGNQTHVECRQIEVGASCQFPHSLFQKLFCSPIFPFFKNKIILQKKYYWRFSVVIQFIVLHQGLRERERERGVLRSWINHLAQMAENMFLKGNVRSLKYLNDEGNIERVKILFEQFRNLRFYPHRNICDLFIHFRMYLIDLV